MRGGRGLAHPAPRRPPAHAVRRVARRVAGEDARAERAAEHADTLRRAVVHAAGRRGDAVAEAHLRDPVVHHRLPLGVLPRDARGRRLRAAHEDVHSRVGLQPALVGLLGEHGEEVEISRIRLAGDRGRPRPDVAVPERDAVPAPHVRHHDVEARLLDLVQHGAHRLAAGQGVGVRLVVEPHHARRQDQARLLGARLRGFGPRRAGCHAQGRQGQDQDASSHRVVSLSSGDPPLSNRCRPARALRTSSKSCAPEST